MREEKVKVGILGATGFTGEKLVELLVNHPRVEISYLSSTTKEPVPYNELFPRFERVLDVKCEPLDVEKIKERCAIVFLALPHTISMEVVPSLLEGGKRIIDLSADYRLKSRELYEKFYGKFHKDEKGLNLAVYGLCEFFKEKIKEAQLVANPGCYPTGIILAIAPLLLEGVIEREIFVSSVSSISGAGRKPYLEYHYINISNNMWAYKPFVHQHIPEIEEVLEELSQQRVELSFVPHIVGVERGIYSTIYISFKREIEGAQLEEIYRKYYSSSLFVRIRKGLPKLKEVVGTNFCDLGFWVAENSRKAVVCSCIDNLIKGAAGNAVQNMNIMLGIEEETGLI